ncbi:MAG: hypothetical protein JNK87_11800 [Bryobacterales bacterium]|nr:hypothetical protein [Bryobacterales bacterium]
MRALTAVLHTAKALAPKIMASPLRAPSILRRHLSKQTTDTLVTIFQTDGDDEPDDAPAAPKYTAEEMYTPVPRKQYAALPRGSQPAQGHSSSSSAQGRVPSRGPGVPMQPNTPMLVLPQGSLAFDQRNFVKYVADPQARLDKYAVTMNRTVTRRGKVLDTKEVKDHFQGKSNTTLGIAIFGHNEADHNKRFMHLVKEWGGMALIWVCVKDAMTGEAIFYSHVGKVHRFHHSSFTAGGSVIGAGEWIIRNGKLWKISPNSGHYRPPLAYFHRAVLLMREAWQPDTVVHLWNVKKDDYEEVPVSKFASDPTGGGSWKTNPNS